MRTLHEIGPELKRAISGNLETDFHFDDPEPQHRVGEDGGQADGETFQRTHSLFNNIVSRLSGSRTPSDAADKQMLRDNLREFLQPRQLLRESNVITANDYIGPLFAPTAFHPKDKLSPLILPFSERQSSHSTPHSPMEPPPPVPMSNGGPRRLPAVPLVVNHVDEMCPTDNGDRYLFLAHRNVPSDSDDDWNSRRSHHVDRRALPPLREPLYMARSQALAMAGMPSEVYEDTYRPVPEGKSLRLPYPSRAEDSRPADRLVGQALALGR